MPRTARKAPADLAGLLSKITTAMYAAANRKTALKVPNGNIATTAYDRGAGPSPSGQANTMAYDGL